MRCRLGLSGRLGLLGLRLGLCLGLGLRLRFGCGLRVRCRLGLSGRLGLLGLNPGLRLSLCLGCLRRHLCPCLLKLLPLRTHPGLQRGGSVAQRHRLAHVLGLFGLVRLLRP